MSSLCVGSTGEGPSILGPSFLCLISNSGYLVIWYHSLIILVPPPFGHNRVDARGSLGGGAAISLFDRSFEQDRGYWRGPGAWGLPRILFLTTFTTAFLRLKSTFVADRILRRGSISAHLRYGLRTHLLEGSYEVVRT